MKEKLGQTFYKLRINKGMKQKDLSSEKLSVGQISNIESGAQMPSAEKFIILLGKLNVGYDEFIFLMDDDYLSKKIKMDKKLNMLLKQKDFTNLVRFSKKAAGLFVVYGDIYFQHVKLITLAQAESTKENRDGQAIKRCLNPIITYLNKTTAWGHYELTLISRCIFLFDIDDAVSFGERALELIENKYSFYKNEEVSCILLTDLAIYTLDYECYYHSSIKYSQFCMMLAATTNNATRAFLAKIAYQIACFKLENGMYSEDKLFSLLEVFKLLEWKEKYDELYILIENHGIKVNKS